ncbi:hypothetical protein QR680_005428 [Steinernema hermaphroditum]|uniref:G-protein coupled receptors family 1 profile domain-containing protein n=1 Tax=Steinernema hermaphroditum TaxID=289476 RepID=A0AA39HS09_9BILA|nr:hypothetical protein QR680_005428 [Steinernema hermaphroditum]
MTNETASEDSCFYQTPRYLTERFFLVTIVGTSVAIVGVVENVFLFFMLARKREHRNSYLLYLMLLAFFDVFVSGAYIPLMSVSLLLDYVESIVLLRAWFAYMVPMITISHIAMTSSSFLILAASFERYINTVMPSRTRVLRKYRRQIAGGAVLLGVITKVSLAFEFSITFNEECVGTMSEYALLLSPLALDHHYNLVWRLWFRNIITCLLPFFMLAFMNMRIVAVLQKTDFELLTVEKISEAQRKSRVRAATRTLLLVVFMYLLSNVLNVIVTIWEYIDMKSLSDEFLPFYIFSVDIVSLLTILAGALRLPIYMACQPHLRREFAEYAKTVLRRKQPQDEQLKRISGIGYTAILMKIGAALIKQPPFEAIETTSVISSASCDSTSEEVFL